MDEETVSINNLPDVLLASIISSLTTTEAARTSTFSHRWKTLWKYSSNLNFDQRQMLKSSIEDYIETSSIDTRLYWAVRRKIAPNDESYMDPITEAAMLINSIMDNHIGPLESCNIRHLPESIASGDVLGWMKKLIEKGVIKVSMELESPDDQNTTDSLNGVIEILHLPFDVFSSFKVLELKNHFITIKPSLNPHQVLKTLTLNNVSICSDDFQEILPYCLSLENLTLEKCDFIGNEVKIDSPSLKYLKVFDIIVHKILVYAANIEVMEFDSIFCNHEDLVFETPKLLVLHAHNDVKKLGRHLTTKDIIEICGGILGRQGSTIGSIFDNLVTLCLDMDLTSTRNSIALSFAINSCHQLKTLEIQNQVNMDLNGGANDQNDIDCLPYPKILFWQAKEPCRCVTHQLKSVCIKGYTCGEFEYEFVKYLILNGGVMENITIWFLDDCLWSEVVATVCLLSYPKLSSKLSFDLKPGVQYMRKFGSNFKKWVTSLK